MPEPYQTGPPIPSGRPTKEQRNWAMLAHLTGLSFLAVPFGNIVGPLLIWQIKREDLGEFVGANAREALNFQFTFVVLLVFSASTILLPLPGVHYLTWPMFLFFSLANVYFCCMAAIETNAGEVYRYPYAFRPF
jgi:hypothetical protein